MASASKLITKHLQELYQQKDMYIELLESDSNRYSEEYLIEQIRIIRGKIDILIEILEELEK